MTPPDPETVENAAPSPSDPPAPPAPPAKPKRKPKPKPAPEGVRAHIWALGDAVLAVPLAGLLASEPDLRGAELPAEEWQKRLVKYLRSERS